MSGQMPVAHVQLGPEEVMTVGTAKSTGTLRRAKRSDGFGSAGLLLRLRALLAGRQGLRLPPSRLKCQRVVEAGGVI